MSMKITVKARFNSSREVFEKFGPGMYLAYLSFEEDGDASSILANLISRQMGVPPSRIEFIGKDVKGNFVFEAM